MAEMRSENQMSREGISKVKKYLLEQMVKSEDKVVNFHMGKPISMRQVNLYIFQMRS